MQDTYVFHLLHQLYFCVEAMNDGSDQTARILNIASLQSKVAIFGVQVNVSTC